MKRRALLLIAIFFTLNILSGCFHEEDSSPCDELIDGLISQDCAAQLLIDNDWAEWVDQKGARMVAWPFILESGDMLEEGFSPEQSIIIVQSPSWFFLSDNAPGAMWNHSTVFILVDAATQGIASYHRNSYPRLNGNGLFSMPGEMEIADVQVNGFTQPVAVPGDALKLSYLDSLLSNNRIAPPEQDGDFQIPLPTNVTDQIPGADDPRFADFPREWPTETDAVRLRRFQSATAIAQSDDEMDNEFDACPTPAECAGAGSSYALVINGGRLGTDNDTRIGDHLRSNNIETRMLSPENDSSASQDADDQVTTIANVEAAFDWLASMANICCDEVLIVIYAHGDPNGNIELNPRQTIKNYRDELVTIGHAGGDEIDTGQLKEMLNKIKSCKVKVLLHSCYSGVHLDNGLNILDPGSATGCMCRTTMISSIAAQITWGGYGGVVDGLIGGDSLEDAWRNNEQSHRPDEQRSDYYTQFGLVQSTPCDLCMDVDGDLILSGIELEGNYSDPTNPDTDGDGLIDSIEREYASDPRDTDKDGDGLSDAEELELGTDPGLRDTDGDGLPDNQEGFVFGDPLDEDTDDDGLLDGVEVFETFTEVNNPNSDGDPATDGEEYENDTDPNDAEIF